MLLIAGISGLLLVTLSEAAFKFNPFTGKPDYYEPGNASLTIAASSTLYTNYIFPTSGTTISFGSSNITTTGTVTGGILASANTGTGLITTSTGLNFDLDNNGNNEISAANTSILFKLSGIAASNTMIFDNDGLQLGWGNSTTGGITREGGTFFIADASSTITFGQVVQVDPGANLGVIPNNLTSNVPIGVAYNAAGVGVKVKVVTNGVTWVKPTTGTAPIRDYIIYSSASEAGSVDQAATLPAVAQHNREIGHFLESCGASQLCRAVIHFN